MSQLIKDRIFTDLEQVKRDGTLSPEKIKEITKNAVSENAAKLEVGSNEFKSLITDAVTTVIEALPDREGEIREEFIAASVEGAIEGISTVKRQGLVKSQEEFKQLQSRIETEEEKLEQQIEIALDNIKDNVKDKSQKIKEAIDSVIEKFKGTEEAAILRKRYAQLKAQLAIVQANLASRYGERYEDVKHYLDEAKAWYEKAKEQPELTAEQVKLKGQEFELKLGEAGTAIAKKERQVKQLLKELWKSLTEIFQDKQ